MIARTFDFIKEENIKFLGSYSKEIFVDDENKKIDEVELLLKKLYLLLKKYPNALNKDKIIKTYNRLKDYSKRNRVSLRDCYSYYDTDNELIEKTYWYNITDYFDDYDTGDDYYYRTRQLNIINKYGIRIVPTKYHYGFDVDVNITKYSMTSDKKFEGKSQLNLTASIDDGLSLIYRDAIIESSDSDYTVYYGFTKLEKIDDRYFDSIKLEKIKDMYNDEDRFLIDDLSGSIRGKGYCKSKMDEKHKKN